MTSTTDILDHRKFWQENLPRLKYHNPNVPMIVNRHTIQDQTPIMTIYFRDPDSADAASTIDLKTQPGSSRTNLSKAQPPAPGERVVHIDMKEKHSSIILEHFMSETRAVPLAPTGEEIAEMQDLDAMAVQAVKDQGRVKALRDERKREEEMLKRARQVGVGDEDS